MADNVILNSGSGGESLATDEVSGAHYQRVKLIHGDDGDNDGDVSATNGLPTQVVAALPAGTNAIGKLAANDGIDIGDVDVTSQPARIRTTDTISAALASGVLMDGTSELEAKSAPFGIASSGSQTIVSAVVGKVLRCVAFYARVSGAVDFYLEDGTAVIFGDSTNKLEFGDEGFIDLQLNPAGWFWTQATNRPLAINLSAGVNVSGTLVYVEV